MRPTIDPRTLSLMHTTPDQARVRRPRRLARAA
jgi:hypothetical protein